MVFQLFNTLGRRLETFEPLKQGEVGMYTCGPTVYDYPHIGNYRTFLFEDILHRYLEFKGYSVYQVMNITDIDDKIIRACTRLKVSIKDYTAKYASAFFEDVDAINIKRAQAYPKATEHIEDMVRLIKILNEKGFAYNKDESFYFSISKFPRYGELSGIHVGDLKVGARVKSDEYAKEEAQDFALWKAWDKADEDIFWMTDLGKGRPGWHIECSAMSMKYLGETFDIHTGGVDNKFPHHENEIAQSEAATGKMLARYWLHAEHLLINGERMGKSLHNFITLRQLAAQNFDPLAIRLFLISGHYGNQLNFTEDGLKQSTENVKRLQEFHSRLAESSGHGATNDVLSIMTKKMLTRFEEAMDNDLNTPVALAALFEFVRSANKEIDSEKFSEDNRAEMLTAVNRVNSVLGVLKERKLVEITSEERRLIEIRQEARKRRDWQEADKIRSKLEEMGILLIDTPTGVKWQRKSERG